ncbi:MAG: ACT domain-containing protein [Planctomycetes bacterium]|nr:ACT domain-containing protein [Planctomycetota bacterium]
MSFEITKVDVWTGEIEERPGALTEKLQAVMRSGACLDLVIAHRLANDPTKSRLHLAPLRQPKEMAAAKEVGLEKTADVHALRIEGPDRPGLAAGITQILADAGFSLTGLSAATIADRAVLYVAFESEEDAVRAAQTLTPALI